MGRAALASPVEEVCRSMNDFRRPRVSPPLSKDPNTKGHGDAVARLLAFGQRQHVAPGSEVKPVVPTAGIPTCL